MPFQTVPCPKRREVATATSSLPTEADLASRDFTITHQGITDTITHHSLVFQPVLEQALVSILLIRGVSHWAFLSTVRVLRYKDGMSTAARQPRHLPEWR